ncbi:MAG: hypothetical protein A2293_07470 [Elusimicrobia bacterium RIFOXYB2_FULL_49_7]|nr:MAG: hypothetical protein A2293_07470 [Elusimicrobia bacterium RIFOXYB2_FULL_49_7]
MRFAIPRLLLSLTFTFLLLACVAANGAKMNGHPTVKWILACQNKDGGFGLYPGDGSNLLATFGAVQTLHRLNIPVKKADKVTAWILTRQNKDGGFKSRWGVWPDTSTLEQTYYAIMTLAITGFGKVDKSPIIAFIDSKHRTDGGYEKDPYFEPAITERSCIGETFWALSALSALGEKQKEAKRTTAFILARENNQTNPGCFGYRNTVLDFATPEGKGSILTTGLALSSLALLGVAPDQPEKNLTYILNQQQTSGEFSKGMGLNREYNDRHIGRMTEAAAALQGLNILVGFPKDPAGLTSWISSCQTPDGAFGGRPGNPSDMPAVYDAVLALTLLKQPIPIPAKPVEPILDTVTFKPAFFTEQMNPNDADEMRYLFRIVRSVKAKSSTATEWAFALKLMEWVNDNMIFGETRNHSGAAIILAGFGMCGPQARAYVSLANMAGIQSRRIGLAGHSATESLINGKWVVIDPVFNDYGHDCEGNLYSAWDIHENFLKNGDIKLTVFGDWRYENIETEMPNGNVWEIRPETKIEDLIKPGAYTKDNY